HDHEIIELHPHTHSQTTPDVRVREQSVQDSDMPGPRH
ncbi:MAG: hypothetical protein JWN05_1447, partial [Arthrobacter sp.]|nr:hypothetical protein [Arthrobacter sp.]